jgi:AAA ATPase domain
VNSNNKGIMIDRLVLVGRRKNYVIPLKSGLNIIYGDSATGKSSVLECINYLFGSSKLVFDEEIESSVTYIMMQVALGESTYVIKRNIFDKAADVEVYASTIESLDEVFPKKYSSNYGKTGPDGFLSDFYLSALDMPMVTMRQAPTKDDSPLVRLSFRDVFKFCYLNQDDVGAKGLLGEGTFNGVKSKETFQYLFNLTDSAISDLQADLSDAIAHQRRTQNTYTAVSDFLRTVEFKTEFDLDDTKRETEARLQLAKTELERINNAITSNNEGYAALKDVLSTINIQIRDEQYVRLRNDYQADIQKLKAVKTSKQLIGTDATIFSCPLCDSQVDLSNIKDSFEINEVDHVSQDINSITRRMKDADQLAERERSNRVRALAELSLLNEEQARARKMLDEEMASAITPYLAERDAWAFELARVSEEIANIGRNMKIRNQQKSIFRELDAAGDRISKLDTALSELKKKAPSISEVITEIGDILVAYLKLVHIADIRDVRISERTFLPVLRNRDYRDVTSGGLRTILSIGHFLSVLACSANRSSNHPGLLMIDTVGKYLGKTDSKYSETDPAEDQKEATSDPKKYMNLYRAMLSYCEDVEKKSGSVQIIVVDNDLPPSIEETSPSAIAAYFRSDGRNGSSRGLIDDAHLQ